jgi:hypothetical protein
MRKKRDTGWFEKFLPFAEPVLAAIVGLVSLLPPFNRPDVAVIVWAVGALFTVSSISTRKQIVTELKESFEEELKEVRDASRILSLYSGIQDDDLIQLKRETLSRCLAELDNLSRGIAPDVRGASFYMWFIGQFKKARVSISSVSSMPESLWVTYELERKSLEANYEAAEQRGVDARRIFVVQDQALLLSADARQVFLDHLAHKVKAFVALPGQITDRTLWELVKEGFVIIDDRVLLVDTSHPPDTAGRMSKVASDIALYRKAFDQLELASIPAAKFLEDFLERHVAELEPRYGTLESLKDRATQATGEEAKELRSVCEMWEAMVQDLAAVKPPKAKAPA